MNNFGFGTEKFAVLVAGNFRREQVAQMAVSGPTQPRDPQSIDARWAEALAKAQQSGRSLFNAELFRLSKAEVCDGHLTLGYGRTCYRDYAMTRSSCPRAPWAGNPDPVGTAMIMITRDGFVPLGRRSASADVNPGRYFTFGGFFDIADVDARGAPDVFACAQRECLEETGLQLSEEQLRLISIVYDLVHPHPEIAFTAHLSQTAEEVRECRWGEELGDLEFVPLSALPAFAAERAEVFTESLLGAIDVFAKELAKGPASPDQANGAEKRKRY